MQMIEIKGAQFGTRIEQRGPDDSHACIHLLSEDDGFWHEKAMFSSFWLDDLIYVLEDTRKRLHTSKKFEKEEYGYRFRDRQARKPQRSK